MYPYRFRGPIKENAAMSILLPYEFAIIIIKRANEAPVYTSKNCDD